MMIVKGTVAKKLVKEIKVDVDKCTGCRSCEMACSAFHSLPKYSSLNPARARIRVIIDESRDMYVPIRAGEYTQAECNGRNVYTIHGKEYSECSFCPACCPSRDYFKEPDSGLPLKCDMCEDEPPLAVPMCVTACQQGALTYVEREEFVQEQKPQVKPEEMEIVFEALVKKHGKKKVIETFARLSKGSH
jgi:benzoyl-CoA reductase subunit BamC